MLYEYSTFQLKSSAIGQVYRMHVALPRYGVASGTRLPVAYVLDGDSIFGFAAGSMLFSGNDLLARDLSQAIIVGIGYDDPNQMGVLRVRDYTPGGAVDEWFAELYKNSPHGRTAEHGGADAFIEFIQDKLHPEVEKRYPVDGEKCALMGHSFGGLFSLYCFIKRIDLFDRYWIGSPGIIGQGRYLLRNLEEALGNGFGIPIRVFQTLGARERTGTINVAHGVEMYQEVAATYDSIDAIMNACNDPNLDYASHEFDDETHSSVIPAAFNRAYRYLMRTPEIT